MKKYIRHLYYLAALLFSKLVLLLPYRVAVLSGGLFGDLAYRLVADARKTTEDNLRRAFPEKDAGEIRDIARNVFINQGKNLFELFSYPKLGNADIERLVRIENPEVFRQALAAGKGVLIVSAHCGNWELMGAALAQAGFPINVIARRIYIEGLNRMLVGYRADKNVRVILRSGRQSAREMLRSLRHNESLAMLIDQDTDVPGVFVDFFGRPAWTPSGLATLALKTGAVVIQALSVREPDDTHRVLLSGPLRLSGDGSREADVTAATAAVTSLIETHIRNHPSQWVWMHRRWKTSRPSGATPGMTSVRPQEVPPV